jgi:diguanylate cyclase (GGDEF)-like protein
MSAAADYPATNNVTEVFSQWRHPFLIVHAYLHARMQRTAVAAAPNTSMVRLITLLAALAAAASAAVLPTAWFLAAEARLRGEVEIRAQLYASDVAEEARQNPVFWNALADSPIEDSLASLAIASRPDANKPQAIAERRRVFSGSGQVLIDTSTSVTPAWPELIARLAVTDGPTRLGEVDIARSLRPALTVTAAVACASCGLGLVMFLLLRVMPLRMLVAAVEHASFVSAHDLLTGLPNRRLFHDRLEQALALARRNASQIGVLYMDLDNFKIINDVLGHPAGDKTLQTVAERLRACVRASDTLARLGGDEFAVILPTLRRPEDADALGQRLLAAIAQPIDLDGQLRHVGISIGVALSDIGAQDPPEQMMKQADLALYQAKEKGRNRLCFYAPDMKVKLLDRHDMERDLRAAITEQRFLLFYQPQVDLRTGQVLAAEALLRWNRPGHGLVPPGRFIGVAEDTGLIVPLGMWVLHDACRRATMWPQHIGIAVNVSTVQLRHAGFCQAVIDIIHETGIAPSRLELEITESVFIQDTAETMATLLRLREIGIKLAMDDFGTGYSSLGYLQKFRFDKIKIDRTFIARLGQERNADAIVRAVVGLTEALGIRAIAEGVETITQAEILRAHGCSEAQGYLYSRPVTAEAFEALLLQGPLTALEPQAWHTAATV